MRIPEQDRDVQLRAHSIIELQSCTPVFDFLNEVMQKCATTLCDQIFGFHRETPQMLDPNLIIVIHILDDFHLDVFKGLIYPIGPSLYPIYGFAPYLHHRSIQIPLILIFL